MGSADSHRDYLRIHPPDSTNAAEDQAPDTTTTARGCDCTAASRGRLPLAALGSTLGSSYG
jgi:hypothetical protein